jgi:uncharacterized membrane protein YkgB
MGIVIQITGSLLVLAGFALAQWGVLDQKSLWYLILNTVGSTVLAINAVFEQQWGFLLLEGVWAIVSAVSLVLVMRGFRVASDDRQSPSAAAQPPRRTGLTGWNS